MRILLALIILLITGGQTAFSQVDKRAETYMMQKITDHLVEELNDLPVNIRRIAIYKVNYNPARIANESVAFVKGEIETTFREHTPISVIAPPELDPTDKLKIIGSDSSLKVMNIRGRSLADMSPELLEGISNKYSVNGLVELTIQKHRIEGMVVLIRILNPQSREIVWSQSVSAYPVEKVEKEDPGKRVVLKFGASFLENESFTTALNPLGEVLVGTNSFNYNFIFGYRQPLNNSNKSYLGIATGANIIRSTENPDFESVLWEAGITFDQAISSKSEEINDYRFMLGVDASVLIAQNEKEGNLIKLVPSLMFNLTENIGFEVHGMLFLSDRVLTAGVTTTNTYTYGQFGYGVKAYVQF